ncbi:NAD 5'-nucleotidase [Tepidimonas alkaliphilus]|uniref:NAD 5'-nucleotidase n=2 Tax=Tepidimonas alkaliphilus TaxID=2588942 RepID=A0A554W6U7_9BURK|nr:NAD 5'-nucleotidase [Tepidimonas alkaliphilus]
MLRQPLVCRPLLRGAMAVAFSAALAGCLGSSDGDPLDLTILHLNDHHSRLDAETTTLRLKNAAGAREAVTVDLGGFARVAGAIEALRSGQPNVLTLHAGDAITGDLYYTLTEGRADATLMNTVCFDALTLGNHEFDNGDAGAAKFIDELAKGSCRTAVLSANLKPRSGSPLAGKVRASTVVQRGGQPIGIVGLTVAAKTLQSSRPDAGTTFEDEATAAQREIDALRAQGVNKIVLLTHLGYQADQQLAARLSGVDVIVGGDSHTLLGPSSFADVGLTPSGPYPTQARNKDGEPVCIVQAWQYAYAVGELRVRFDGRGVVTECAGQPHVLVSDNVRRSSGALSDADRAAMVADLRAQPGLRVQAPSPKAEQALAPLAAEKAAFGQTKVGAATEELCLRRVPGTKRDVTRSALGDVCNKSERVNAHGGDIQQLVAQAFLEQGQRFGGADIALQNAGGVRVDIAPGDITVGRVYTLLPFKNTLVRLRMSGAQVKAALEDGLTSVLAGNTGAYPYAAGLRFEVDLNQPAGQRVSNLQWRNPSGSWVPLDSNATYRVIANDFMAGGGDGYATLKAIAGANREDTFLDYADAFLQYVKGRGNVARLPLELYSTQRFIDTP